ncbi:MAG: hypothetical protein FD138_122, partial [Planctomycetota bacterium]
AGSDFDTLLAIYSGSTLGGLTSVGSNDDFGGTRQSSVTFTAVAGTAYHIAVDGFGNSSGNITLNISAMTSAPAPGVPPGAGADSVGSATVVTSVSMPVVNNSTATSEVGEPYHAGINGGYSVWWLWTPVSGGSVTIDTSGSNFDTLLAVYSGPGVFVSFAGLTPVASNDDSGGTRQSSVTFVATAGTSYYIAVDGYHGAFGDIHLNLSSLLP